MLKAMDLYNKFASDPIALQNFVQTRLLATEAITQAGASVRKSLASMLISLPLL